MNSEMAPVLARAAEFLFEQAGQHPDTATELAGLAVLLQQLTGFIDDYAVSALQHGETIKALVTEASRMMPTAERQRIEAALAFTPAAPEDFHARALGAYLERLEAVMVQAHDWLETSGDDRSIALVNRFWDYMDKRAQHESRLIPPVW